jgi:hypothetical protein
MEIISAILLVILLRQQIPSPGVLPDGTVPGLPTLKLVFAEVKWSTKLSILRFTALHKCAVLIILEVLEPVLLIVRPLQLLPPNLRISTPINITREHVFSPASMKIG